MVTILFESSETIGKNSSCQTVSITAEMTVSWISANRDNNDSTVPSILSGLETRSLGHIWDNAVFSLVTLSPSQSSAHGFLSLTSTKQWVNVTCSRPQQTVPRPGHEPGTPWSVVRDTSHCDSLPHKQIERGTNKKAL